MLFVTTTVHGHPPRSRHLAVATRNAERDTSVESDENRPLDRSGTKKPAAPIGDERCLARGTTPLRHVLHRQHMTHFARTAQSSAGCGDPVTGAPSVAAY